MNMNVSKPTLVRIASLTWFFIGIFLFSMGLYYTYIGATLLPTLKYDGSFSILYLFAFFKKAKDASALVTILALAIGFLKGRFVLKRTVTRQIERISKLPEKAPITEVYSKGLYLLIGGMMLLGMSIKHLPIFYDTRGFIDLAIGFALMNGSFHYLPYLNKLSEKLS